MKKFIVFDNCLNLRFECDTENEVMECCGYDVDDMTFNEFYRMINGGDYDIEIIEE
jgi:hypothetical protein